MDKFEIGDRVLYSGCFGSDEPKLGTIDSIGEKNERIVYGVQLDNGESKWGYADQFILRATARARD